MLIKARGIVIRTTDYGEGNKIVVLLTEDIGKVTVMARGAKKARSRHTATTQLFTLGEYVFYRKAGMGTLNDGEMVRSRAALRADIEKTAFAAYVVELVDRLVADGEASAALFRQLNAALDGIEAGKDAPIIAIIFELKMLHFAGYAPVLTHCAHCGNQQDSLVKWSPRMGGVVCARCGQGEQATHMMALDEKARKLLHLLQQVDLARLGKITVSPENRRLVQALVRSFSEEHLPFTLKSRRFLDQMERFM